MYHHYITNTLFGLGVYLHDIIITSLRHNYPAYERHTLLKETGDNPIHYFLLQVRLLRIEKMKKEEAERIRREEEERLRQKMRETEARREADRLHQERLKQIEEEKRREEERREEERRERVEEVRRKEEEAKQRRDMPVEDSKVVEEMFGFLGDQPNIDPCEHAHDNHVIDIHVSDHPLMYCEPLSECLLSIVFHHSIFPFL